MDELNLSDRFGGPDERMPMPRKKKRRTIPGTGMEKPTVRFEDEEGPGGLEDLTLEEEGEGPEEDEVFEDLVSRMSGESASAGRARAKRKAKAKPRFGNDSMRAEFADREE